VRQEVDSLSNSISSYYKNGLLQYVDEVVIFFNGWLETLSLNYQKLNIIEEYNKKLGKSLIRYIKSNDNIRIGEALDYLIGNATKPNILFLEKDWELIENKDVMKRRIRRGLELLHRRIATVVRYRHRKNPGDPNWSAILFQDAEEYLFK